MGDAKTRRIHAMVVLLALVMIGASGYTLFQHGIIVTTWVKTTATVDDISVELRRGRSSGPLHSYWPTVTYRTDTGNTLTVKTHHPTEPSFAPGDKIIIYYNEKAPRRPYIPNLGATWLLPGGGLILGLWIFWMSRRIRQAR